MLKTPARNNIRKTALKWSFLLLRNLWLFNADDNSKIKQKIWKDPSRKLSHEYTSINHFIKDYKCDYTEAQIHGDLSANDVNYVLVPEEELTENLRNKLKEKGIKYEVGRFSND